MAFRSQSTTKAPMPAMTNIQRQPKLGMISQPARVEANRPKLVTKLSRAAHRPRFAGGVNSIIVP